MLRNPIVIPSEARDLTLKARFLTFVRNDRRIASSLSLLTMTLCFTALFLVGCTTTGPQSRINLNDPSTNVRVNFLRGNYDEVIRYGNTVGKLDEKDQLKVLYYVGLSHLSKNHFVEARKSFVQLKERDGDKNYADLADTRIADSFFLEKNYAQAFQLYSPIPQKYPKSEFLPYVYYRLVLASQKVGDFSQAKRNYEILNKNYPESFEAIRLTSVLDPMDLEGFSVQVGSFSDRNKAAGMQSMLLNKGYVSSVKKSQKDNVIYYRVRIYCKSRPEAERIATKLRLEGLSAKVFP